MRIYIGADHRGFELKKKIAQALQGQGHTIVDVGTYEPTAPCDYPRMAYDVAMQVTQNPDARGILVCMTGIGQSIAANKVPGAYAALCYTKEAAVLSRQHNNANILVLGAKFVAEADVMDMIAVWLTTSFEGGRHLRRVEQIKKIEKEFMK